MIMFNPGASVRVNFPKRSMVQSYPCGTVLMPANSVTTTSSTSTMAKISKPPMKNLPKAKTPATPAHPTTTMCQALQRSESLLVVPWGCRVRHVEKPADHDPIRLNHHDLISYSRMTFSENRFPLFRTMLQIQP